MLPQSRWERGVQAIQRDYVCHRTLSTLCAGEDHGEDRVPEGRRDRHAARSILRRRVRSGEVARAGDGRQTAAG